MSVPSPLYNQSQVKPSQAPRQFLGTGPGWTLQPTIFGVDTSRGPISMSEFSTHMPLPTANNASPQPTENMRGLRSGLMNNASGKWSMALLLPSSCHSLVGVEMQQISATRGSHPCSQTNGTNPTAPRWPGCDASSPSPCCVLRSNAYAGPALLVATHLDRPSPPQTLWRQSQTCHFKYFDST